MRTGVILIISLLLITSCGSLKKSTRNKKKTEAARTVTTPAPTPAPVVTPVEKKPEPAPSAPIKEVVERVVPIERPAQETQRYFVIIGSFRNPDNARKYQLQISRDNFKSEILKSETGFYRVSVMATDDEEKARDEIKRIRSTYPKYHDSWLLIQKR
ncbi:MAG TPA: SPOR domain-containing protein [Bacteroidales bacterium]|nr:SPOR domain-containing protein [Bacteroidales bacterium]HOK74258.1 SPOR domain-containing protein [Bacteroidales bacterium]HOM41450.1 SPOR domain-containing protein [Bacteroidales bacterium]HPP93715.1 SPOR domain-containing protein [Bacteroidales bacterium]HQK72130.1 SPOR domain-containing protein [Bacteroidales bacterium]